MRGEVFVDSNVLLYVYEIPAPEKRKIASDWLFALSDNECARTNLQVLNEITNVLSKRMRQFHPTEIFAIVDEFAKFGTEPITPREVGRARALYRRYRYSWWDSLLLASALELGCSHFLSEDMQDGQDIEGLTIIDPFAHSPQEILISR